MKFLAFATAAAVATVASAQTVTPAPTPVPCLPLNLSTKTTDIRSLNGVIDLAISSGLLKNFLVDLDPLNIVEERLDALPFSVLGMNFTLTPILKSLNATGIATIVPEHLNVTGPQSLAIGVNFNGTIDVDAALSFEIAQLNKQWWQICWTSAAHPISCPPTTIDIILGVGLDRPTLDLNTTIGYNTCPPGLPRGTCTEVTVSNILVAALNNRLGPLLDRILKKLSSASVDAFAVGVGSLTKLKFDFARSNALLTALFEKILGYTAEEVNKKGWLYNEVVKIVGDLGKTLLNDLIADELAPRFGNTCY